MKGRERTEQFMWRVAVEDLPKLKSFERERNEPHWITTRTILNTFEELRLQNAEIHDTNTRLKNKLEERSKDMLILARHIFRLGYDDVDQWGISEAGQKLINLDTKISDDKDEQN